MAIPHATRMQLQPEVVTPVTDFTDFDEDSLNQLAENLRKLGGTILDPDLARCGSGHFRCWS